MNSSIFRYVIENTGFIIQIFIYILILIFLNSLIKPENKKFKIRDDIDLSGLSKEDKKMIKMGNSSFMKLFIPLPSSGLYQRTKKKLKKTDSDLVLFFIKRIYYFLITLCMTIVINSIPFIMFLTQKTMGVEEPLLLLFPKWVIVFTLLLPIFVYFYPSIEANLLLKKKEVELKKEIIPLGIFVHTLLETGNNPYDILSIVKEIKPVYKNYIEAALNKYYVDTKKALEELKQQVGLWEFDMIVDSLIYAYETNNVFAAEFLNEYITRLEQTFKISSEKANKVKPYVLLFGSVPPLIAALAIWFYPWIVQATENLTKGFGM